MNVARRNINASSSPGDRPEFGPIVFSGKVGMDLCHNWTPVWVGVIGRFLLHRAWVTSTLVLRYRTQFGDMNAGPRENQQLSWSLPSLHRPEAGVGSAPDTVFNAPRQAMVRESLFLIGRLNNPHRIGPKWVEDGISRGAINLAKKGGDRVYSLHER